MNLSLAGIVSNDRLINEWPIGENLEGSNGLIQGTIQ
jgi:hypothetical protein